MITESMTRLMANKLDYQLKWILDNQNDYSHEFVLAAREELDKREKSVKSLFDQLLNRINKFLKF